MDPERMDGAGEGNRAKERKVKRPRAKTKQNQRQDGHKSSLANDADDEGNNKCDNARPSAQVAPEVRWTPSGDAGGEQRLLKGAKIYTNPLISISMVAGSSERSPTSCASSLWSLRSQVAIDECEASEQEGEEANHDRASMQPLNRNNSAQFSGEWLDSSVKSQTQTCDQQDLGSMGSNASLSGLDAVKCSYTKLINYNKLQCFYLGTLLFSLSSLIFLLKIIASGGGEQGSPRNSSTMNETAGAASKTLHVPLHCAHLNPHTAWLMAATALPLTLMLLLLVVVKLVRFNLSDSDLTPSISQQPEEHEFSTTTNRKRFFHRAFRLLRKFDKCFGATLSVALLLLPTAIVLIYQRSVECLPDPIVPMILLAALIYILPLALAEIRAPKTYRIRNHATSTISQQAICSYLVCGAIILPTIWLILAKYHQREVISVREIEIFEHWSQLRVILVLAVVALVCGQIRRRLLVHLASESIFKGASELIEAKVSLEQQRQQQETLLLSVLPAYVAEQVKRNMVKKMESLDEQQLAGTLDPSPSTTTTTTPNHHHHHVLLVGTSNASTQTFGSPQVRSLTLPAVANDAAPTHESAPKAPRLTAGGARQRNSFVTFSRLSTSLASGAVFLSESLLNRNTTGTTNQKATTDERIRSQRDHQNVSTGTQVYVSASGANSSNHLTSLHHVPTTAAAAPSQSSSLMPIAAPPTAGSSLQQQQSRRGFNELYIRTYNNVSLLYGDIVGFTSLCTQLSSSQLVRVLNNLFSYFDHLADRHKIMRIKILGDCYYGVSGIPEFAVMGAKSGGGAPKNKKTNRQANSRHGHHGQHHTDNHAINCVNMGLDMIKYIKCLNIEREHACYSNSSSDQQLAALVSCANTKSGSGSCGSCGGQRKSACSRQHSAASSGGAGAGADNPPQLPAHFELNMRIGIHTGHIHSGVIGLKKWQFDVWSNDVSIAMHCESSGVAGRVQVTEATMQHLNEAFTFEPAPSTAGPQNVRDSFLVDKDIRTYLIKERVEAPASSPNKLKVAVVGHSSADSPADRKRALPAMVGAAHNNTTDSTPATTTTNTMDEDKIRAATIGTIRQTLLSAEMPGASSTSALALALEHNDLKWLSLNFHETHQQQQYLEHSLSFARLMRELLQLLMLIGTLWLVDKSFLTSQGGSSQMATNREFALIFGSASLLLFVIGARLLHSSKSVATNGASSSCDTADLGAPASFSHLVELAQMAPNNEAKKFQWAIEWRRFLCDNRLAAHFRSKFQRRETALKVAQSGLGHYLNSLLFAILMIGQLYLIQNDVCAKHSTVISSSVVVIYQISAFLMLVTLDLSAVLFSYRLKSTLILLIAIFQFVACVVDPKQQQQMHADQLCRFFIINRSDEAKAKLSIIDVESENHLVLWWFNDLLLFVLALWSLAYARKLDYSNRCNFLWRNRLNVDHEELEYISGINKVLLENILPSHVVQHYLSTANNNNNQQQQATVSSGASQSRRPFEMTTVVVSRHGSTSESKQQLRHQLSESGRISHRKLVRMSISNMHRYLSHEHELYHEQHDSVAVMFASIPHFYEFYDESDISKQGLGCIALLNEIICDFDKLLLKNKFSRIEKIKTIGSTYMAAAGLRPNPLHAPASNRTSSSSSSQVNIVKPPPTSGRTCQVESNTCQLSSEQAAKIVAANQQTRMNLICMIQFASSLMSALNGINKQSFQVFKLRVGVNTGPVIAGIIGAQRPFYDIWGDCVNIASRMESLGEIGRIQVEERTAKLLMECLCTDTYQIEKRGHIDVKGKGGMVTYFVDKRQPASQAQHVQHQSSLQQQLSCGEMPRDATTLASSHESLDKQQQQQQQQQQQHRLERDQQVPVASR